MSRRRHNSRDSAADGAEAADYQALFNSHNLNAQDQDFLAEQALLDAVEQPRTPTRSSFSRTPRRSSTHASPLDAERPTLSEESAPYDPSSWEAISNADAGSRSCSTSARRRATATQYSPSMPAWSPSNRTHHQRHLIPYDPTVPLHTIAPARFRRRPSNVPFSPMLYDPKGYLHRSVCAAGGGEPSPRYVFDNEDEDDSYLQLSVPLTSLADLHARLDRAFAGIADEQLGLHERLDYLFHRFEDRIGRLEALVRNLLDFGRPNLHTVFSEPSDEGGVIVSNSPGSKRKRSSSASAKRVSFEDAHSANQGGYEAEFIYDDEDFIDEEAVGPATSTRSRSRHASCEPASPRNIASPRTPPRQRDRTPSWSPPAWRKGRGSGSGNQGSAAKKRKTTSESPKTPSPKRGSNGLPAPAASPNQTSKKAASRERTPTPPPLPPANPEPRRSARIRNKK